jgi:magnesium transporter
MLRVYSSNGSHLAATDLTVSGQSPPIDVKDAIWFDLLHPTREEDHYLEELLSLSIPTKEEAQELEVSARLYNDRGAEFMTMTGVTQLESDAPSTTPITFILKGHQLVTVRYAEPKPFWLYSTRVQKPGGTTCDTGEHILLGLAEALIGRMAEALDMVGRSLEELSREVFRQRSGHKPGKSKRKTRDFEDVIEQVGAKGDLIAMIRESLVSLSRLLAYHTASASQTAGSGRSGADWVRSLVQDVAALSDHASYLANKTAFLLDATLGLINLQQNKIIKLFSIVAVVLLPPTLVATVYGMNFKQMPELEWTFGYPMALALMIVTGVLPYLWVRQKGWLN